MANASVIRPGLLVSLKSTVKGGVSYQRTELEKDETKDGQAVARWETKRVIEDKAEHEAATKCRSQALSLIRKVCSTTTFGLLCPNDQEGALDEAIKAARKLVDNHNEQSSYTQVAIFVLKGRVASDDAEAARAITSEIATLVQKMDAGITKFDPKAIREAADRARELSNMLDDSKKTKIDAAIAQARKAARDIVKRVEKNGEDTKVVMLDIQRGQIEQARIAFLDMSGESTVAAEDVTPVVEKQRFADLDVEEAPAGGAASMTRAEAIKDVKRREIEMMDELNEEQKAAAPSITVPALEV